MLSHSSRAKNKGWLCVLTKSRIVLFPKDERERWYSKVMIHDYRILFLKFWSKAIIEKKKRKWLGFRLTWCGIYDTYKICSFHAFFFFQITYLGEIRPSYYIEMKNTALIKTWLHVCFWSSQKVNWFLIFDITWYKDPKEQFSF